MSEELPIKEEKAIEIVQNLINQTKENVKNNIENLSENRITNRILGYRALETLLDLYQKEKQKNKELEKENHEIRQWKYTIDTIEDLDRLKELDLIKIKGKEYISKDKIRELIKDINEETQYLGKDRGETKQHYAVRKIIELLEERNKYE